MTQVYDYNPLAHIKLPGADLANPNGIIIVVGPNSSGKTNFLKDIASCLIDGQESFVVCESVEVRFPSDISTFCASLIDAQLLLSNQKHPSRFVLNMPQLSFGKLTNSRPVIQLETLDQLCASGPGHQHARQEFFTYLGPVIAIPLTLENRRAVCGSQPNFDSEKNPPSSVIQRLLIDSHAQEILAKETARVFSNTAWLTTAEAGRICIRVSGSAREPSHIEASNPNEARAFRAIEEEGDGIQSYVGVCITLLVGLHAVSLIDEPELCLHPPQAHHIGRFIGQHSKSRNHVTFVATHSSEVVRGILETAKETQVTIVRLVQKKRSFWAHVIGEQDLLHSLKHPRTRAEIVLDGLFSQGVILVESEGDQEVYQAAAEAIPDYPSREVHFVPASGTGGLAELCRFYRTLEIPIALIADLDAICDEDKVTKWVSALCRSAAEAEAVCKEIHDLVQQVKTLPPSITPDEVKAAGADICNHGMRWESGDDQAIRKRLRALDGRLKRLGKLKKGGIAAYDDNPQIKSKLESIINTCAHFGLFFVPGGELESWVKDLMVGYSDRNKAQWATEAAARIRAATNQTGDVWDFARKVFEFVNAERDAIPDSESLERTPPRP